MTIEIIAELAQGFEGKAEQASLLLKAAAAAGADAAKFQLVYADELATPDYKYHGLFTSLEMKDEQWSELRSLAEKLNVRLYLDVFGTRSLRLAEKLAVSTVKLHGTDIANRGFLEHIAASKIPRILLGAGGAMLGELQQALKVLSRKEVVVLAGFQGYPTPNGTNQIARVRKLIDVLGRSHPQVAIGFADHAPPDSPLRHALAASALGAGATVLEKHLTLGKVMKMEDHEAALNPDEFLEFCQIVRACHEAMGVVTDADDFGMSQSEYDYRKMIRRHVVAGQDLPSGCRLAPNHLVLKRTSSDQVLTDLESVYGKTLDRAVAGNTPIPRDGIH